MVGEEDGCGEECATKIADAVQKMDREEEERTVVGGRQG
jgi:hypothetical protein